jgi:hypothetical protein
MSKTEQLPAEIHDHFRKANVLHTYVQTELGEAKKHALETGEHLLAAKKAVPHGSWEFECNRLFDGSIRTAQFYMSFFKDFSKLKSAQKSALLMLEGTLTGAAKAAKQAAKPKPHKEPPATECEVIDVETVDVEQVDEKPDLGKCPNCGKSKWDEDEDGYSCAGCHHPHGEPVGDPDESAFKKQRQKTVKTCEALMRAFCDLNRLSSNRAHKGCIESCKGLLKIAKEWT